MKILCTHSYFLRFDPKQWSTGLPYAPLGTLYALSYLRSKGFNTAFFDTMFSKSPAEIIPILENEKPDILVIYDDGFNYLTKMCLDNMRKAAFDMIHFAKERGCLVVVSSSDSTDHFDVYLKEGADFVLMGEAEITLHELIDKLENNFSDFENIEGIVYKTNNVFVKTRRRSVIKDLDSLPFPAWDLIDINPYRKMWKKHSGYFSINISTTRGCPFKCNWCAKPIYGNRYNSRSPQNVMAELNWLKKLFSFDHIWFCDDILGLRPGWIKDFADLVEQSNFKLRFKMQGRVDLLLQENNIRDLKRAGCENIWMGAESGSQRILDAMDKGTNVNQIYEATRLLKANGIKPSLFIQFGYLTETKEDISKTIDMINDLLPFEIGISVSYPLPGTVFYEKVRDQMKQKTHWTDSDDLALMFQNTYQPSYYKQLHRFVHNNYRKRLAIDNFKSFAQRPFNSGFEKIKSAASIVFYAPLAYFEKLRLNKLEEALP